MAWVFPDHNNNKSRIFVLEFPLELLKDGQDPGVQLSKL